MSHDNQYDSKNDRPCLETLAISCLGTCITEIPCERKTGHTKDHQADVRDAQGRILTVQWRKARVKD